MSTLEPEDEICRITLDQFAGLAFLVEQNTITDAQARKELRKNTAFYLCSQFLRCNMHWPKANCCQRMHVSP